MKVTDKKYYMDDALKSKMDLMVARSTGKNKMDNLVIIDGDEGYGKTNMSIALGYYYAYKTGRPFSVKNVFFSADKLLKFAQNTEDQVIIYDESALSAMSIEWFKKEQQNLIDRKSVV